MTLIAILLSLVVERFLGSMEELRRFTWFHSYYRWGSARLSGVPLLDGPLGTVLLLLPLVGVVIVFDYYLSNTWLLFGLAFAVLVLLYCLGPYDLEAEVEAFLDARERGDEESACWHAAELLGDNGVSSSAGLSKRIMENIFVEANERVLAILFWFVLLGPGGALLYRLSSQLDEAAGDDDGMYEAGIRLHLMLAWLPARLAALSFALAGSFVEAIHGWRSVGGSWYQSSRQVLIASGFGALRVAHGELEDDSEDCVAVAEAMALVRRAVLVILAAIALFTLSGWLS